MNDKKQAFIEIFGFPDSVTEIEGGLSFRFGSLAIQSNLLGYSKAALAGASLQMKATLAAESWVCHSALAISSPSSPVAVDSVTSKVSSGLSVQTSSAAKSNVSPLAVVTLAEKKTQNDEIVEIAEKAAEEKSTHEAPPLKDLIRVSDSAKSPEPAKSVFSGLSKRPEASNSLSRSVVAAGPKVVTSMFSRAPAGNQAQSQPPAPAPAQTSVHKTDRPRFNLNSSEDPDMDIPF